MQGLFKEKCVVTTIDVRIGIVMIDRWRSAWKLIVLLQALAVFRLPILGARAFYLDIV